MRLCLLKIAWKLDPWYCSSMFKVYLNKPNNGCIYRYADMEGGKFIVLHSEKDCRQLRNTEKEELVLSRDEAPNWLFSTK